MRSWQMIVLLCPFVTLALSQQKMKKDIPFLPVEGIQVAIVRTVDELNAEAWHVALINRNAQPITNVFVTSRGYGSLKAMPIRKPLHSGTFSRR